MLRRLGECSSQAARTTAGAARTTAGAAAAARRPRAAAPVPAAAAANVRHRRQYASARATSAPSATAAARSGDSTRGLSSSDMFDGKPTSAFLKARLMRALGDMRPGMASAAAQVDEQRASAVLHAANSLRGYPDVLQPHLHEISSALSRFYIAHPVAAQDLPVLQDLLGDACLTPRSVASQRERLSQNSVSVIANRYAAWLVSEAKRARAPDDERANAVLTAFEDQVRRLTQNGVDRLVMPFVAAWAVLNACTGRTPPDDIFLTFPHESSVIGWVSANEWLDAAGGADVNAAVHELCLSQDGASLPSKVDALGKLLFSLRNRGQTQKVVETWMRYAAELDRPAADGERPHPLAANVDVRMQVLARFLSVVRSRSSVSTSRTADEREAMSYVEKQVRKRVPHPTPLPVLHALLATAGPDDLDGATTAGVTREKTAVLAAAREIWETARAEGVVLDEKAYGLYLGLLGRYHEGMMMFKVWDELVADRKCRELEESLGKARAMAAPAGVPAASAWPSTMILNQVLSSSFFIGSQTAGMAVALFRIAIDPASGLAPNLFTLNIALRFAAHTADIKLMNEVISAAAPLGLSPDIVTYTTLVQGLLRADRPELARQTLESMKSRGFEPNERMATMLVADLSASGTAGGLTRAEEVIREMRVRGIRTTVQMWTSLIAGYFRGGWQVDAWGALDRMRASGLRLNSIGYNVLMREVLVSGEVATAAGATAGMGKSRERRAAAAQPGADAEGDAKGHAGDDASPAAIALRIFNDMLAANVEPTQETYSVLVHGLMRLGAVAMPQLREVLRTMDRRGFHTTKASLVDAIRAARRGLETAERAAERARWKSKGRARRR